MPASARCKSFQPSDSQTCLGRFELLRWSCSGLNMEGLRDTSDPADMEHVAVVSEDMRVGQAEQQCLRNVSRL
jgi:hypothetical protein